MRSAAALSSSVSGCEGTLKLFLQQEIHVYVNGLNTVKCLSALNFQPTA